MKIVVTVCVSVAVLLALGWFVGIPLWVSKREPALLAALEAEIVAFESREVSRPPAFGEPLDVDAMECYRRSAQAVAELEIEWSDEEREAISEQLEIWARGEGPIPETAEERAR